MTRLLIADPVFSKFSHIYMFGPKALEYLVFKPERELAPINNLRLTMESESLPFDITEQIILVLIDDYIKCQQLAFALPLITICKSILKRFYRQRFVSDGNFEKIPIIVARLSKMFKILQVADDQFIDLVAYPNGHNDNNVFTMKLFYNWDCPTYPILPWSFKAETLGTITPPTIYSFYYSNASLPDDIVAEIITGPTQYEMVYIKGRTLKGGVVEVTYLKSPVVIFQLCDLVMPMEGISPELLCNPVWKQFGVFARLFFGANAGIYISVTCGLPHDFPEDRPVIFEI